MLLGAEISENLAQQPMIGRERVPQGGNDALMTGRAPLLQLIDVEPAFRKKPGTVHLHE
jgi:hypothetical protein